MANTPRGIRNNNPGNIEYGEFARSRGATGSDGRFAIFPTPEAGMAAMGDLLGIYQTRHGLNTVAGMIGRWAPPGDNNDTGAYARRVAATMGIDPNQPFDINDPALRQAMINGMIEVENGYNPYSGATPPPGPGLVSTAAATASQPQPSQPQRQSLLERIRARIQDRNPDRDTPVLDGMIANRDRRRQAGRPMLEWMREQRQNAGYQTPVLDRLIGQPETQGAQPTTWPNMGVPAIAPTWNPPPQPQPTMAQQAGMSPYVQGMAPNTSPPPQAAPPPPTDAGAGYQRSHQAAMSGLPTVLDVRDRGPQTIGHGAVTTAPLPPIVNQPPPPTDAGGGYQRSGRISDAALDPSGVRLVYGSQFPGREHREGHGPVTMAPLPPLPQAPYNATQNSGPLANELRQSRVTRPASPPPSTPSSGVPYVPPYGPQLSVLEQLGGRPAAPPVAPARPTMQTTFSDMAARDLFSLIP